MIFNQCPSGELGKERCFSVCQSSTRILLKKGCTYSFEDESYRGTYSLVIEEGGGYPDRCKSHHGLVLALGDAAISRSVEPHTNYWSEHQQSEQ
jgi:hypothetical protein